ncbi:SET and MYND domain-containing protein 4-like isoform X2 [Penaeus japonicus]|uniref:SET and MYND domain-containing protein 4-like isoform X2 n=1 Tax=Penaeus japonicus TaxID=27405 RepID=UPI001C7171BC|nr:SET and MYND domain-containing protein 4-like isoform X2 [Penaeus japonicus]
MANAIEAPLMKSNRMLQDSELPGFFKDYFRVIRKSVSNDEFNQFSKLKSDEERVRFIFDLPAAHEIDIQTFFKGKSEKEAMEKKEAGNKLFGRKKNMEALKLYSQAVVHAPVPTEECADPKKMTLYAICLANRSAALFHLKEFYYCIKDIDEALEHHYPRELKHKLYKRKGRLLVNMRQYVDAREAYRQALKWLDWAKVEREKRIDLQGDVQKWLKMFEGSKNLVNHENEFDHSILFPKLPELCQGQNEQFPSLSKKLTINEDNSQGRYAIAKENIEPGDALVTEKPYASVLLREEFGSHCQNCFLLTKAPVPCKKCSSVLFCSVECRNASYFHTIECPILDLLVGSGMSINCFLALRILTQSPISFFLEMKDKLENEKLKETTEAKDVYDPTDFFRLYNLVTHSEQRTPEDWFHRTCMVVFLVKALKKTKYFEDKGTQNNYPLFKDKVDKINDVEAYIGSLLLHFLQVVQFNAHEVSEFVTLTPKSLNGAKNETIGAAIYPTLALFNHSCHGAQVRYFSGNSVITKAIRHIAKGEIVPENYGQHYASRTKSQRRNALLDRYWFECSCEPCQKDWPLFKEMEHKVMYFKCHKCQGPLPVNVSQTVIPFFKCDRCGDQTNILGALKNLQNTEQTFKAACKEMETFDLEKAESLLVENMKQLDAVLYPPYRDYHLTQEAYMRCCLHAGNHRVGEPKPDPKPDES